MIALHPLHATRCRSCFLFLHAPPSILPPPPSAHVRSRHLPQDSGGAAANTEASAPPAMQHPTPAAEEPAAASGEMEHSTLTRARRPGRPRKAASAKERVLPTDDFAAGPPPESPHRNAAVAAALAHTVKSAHRGSVVAANANATRKQAHRGSVPNVPTTSSSQRHNAQL